MSAPCWPSLCNTRIKSARQRTRGTRQKVTRCFQSLETDRAFTMVTLFASQKNNLIQRIFFPSSRGLKLTNKQFDEQIPRKLCFPSYDKITHRRNSELEFVLKASCSVPYVVSILNSCGFRWFRTVNHTIYTRTSTTHKLKPKHTTSTIPLVISVLPESHPICI